MGELKQRLIVLAGAALLAVVGRRLYQLYQMETRRFADSWKPHARVVLVDGCRA